MMTVLTRTLVATACLLLAPLPLAAETSSSTAESDPVDAAMDALLAQQKESRKACKVEICSILRSKKADGPDVACHVVQTWPKKALDRIVGKAAVSWPLGHAHCQTDLKLKRTMLAAAMSETKYVAEMERMDVACEIERGAGEDPYKLKVSIQPKITFENGKATAAEMQWGTIEAPALAKGVIWPVAKLDNSLGVLSGQVVDMVNQFLDKKCDEVKDELSQ